MTRNRTRTARFLLLTLVGCLAAAPDNTFAKPNSKHVPGRLLVKFQPGLGKAHKNRIAAEHRAYIESELDSLGVDVVVLPEEGTEKEFEKIFRKKAEVEFAEVDQLVPPGALTPNDPFYSNEWHLTKINGPDAWSNTTGDSGLTVAIIDTGVDPNHPDLAAKLVPGWNFYNNNSDSSDVYGHGTKVAGTVAAMSNNGTGVASVCWNCYIMPLRVSRADGYASWSTIATALGWAANQGARVANISYQVTTSSTVTTAAKNFWGKGGVVVSSAGNDGKFVTYADNPYIVTVGATDPNDALYSWSTAGNNIDLVAPGCTYTTLRGGGYGSGCGTSYSSPIVAGVAALVFSMNASLTPQKVTDILRLSADDLGAAGWDSTFGAGRVNASQAVASVVGAGTAKTTDTTAPSVQITSPGAGSTVSGTVTIQVAASDNIGVSSVALYLDGAPAGADSAAPYSFAWNTTAAANGGHVLEARATDAAGNTASTKIPVTVSNSVADTTAPAIQITSPVNGTMLSAGASVTCQASDNVGVVKVELYVNGRLSRTSTAAPFSFYFSLTNVQPGTYTLIEKAYDAAGNWAASAPVTVYK